MYTVHSTERPIRDVGPIFDLPILRYRHRPMPIPMLPMWQWQTVRLPPWRTVLTVTSPATASTLVSRTLSWNKGDRQHGHQMHIKHVCFTTDVKSSVTIGRAAYKQMRRTDMPGCWMTIQQPGMSVRLIWLYAARSIDTLDLTSVVKHTCAVCIWSPCCRSPRPLHRHLTSALPACRCIDVEPRCRFADVRLTYLRISWTLVHSNWAILAHSAEYTSYYICEVHCLNLWYDPVSYIVTCWVWRFQHTMSKFTASGSK